MAHRGSIHHSRCRATFWGLLVSTFLLESLSCSAAEGISSSKPSVIVVVGAGGDKPFEKMFREWADRWIKATETAGSQATVIGLDELNNSEPDRKKLEQSLDLASKSGDSELWIVLIGHGTFDRREARFNLRGPDFTAKELAVWLKPNPRPTAIINCSTASAPFLNALAGPNRIVIAATKSGVEQNFAHFGDFMSSAITAASADVDKDDQTSLWEAFLSASRQTAEFYSIDGRLMTEHALLDDNGDGLGVRSDQFRGLTPIEVAKDGKALDGQKAHQWHLIRSVADSALSPVTLQKRNELELQVIALRQKKSELSREEYFHKLEKLLVELALLGEASTP